MPPVLISQVSQAQAKALAIVPKCSSLLSLLGSIYIVYDVLRMPHAKLYHRLMLGMSLFDCMASSAWFFTTWPIPPEVFPAYGAMGTQATCTAQGFFAQLSISTVFYNGSLSAYYLLVIFYGWSDGKLRSSKIEYFFHGVSISVGIGTSSAAAAMGLLNPIGWDCWLSAVPLGCKESWLNNGQTTCTRGDNANLWQWLFFYLPLWIVIFFVTITMALIVSIFYHQQRAVERWDPGSTSSVLEQQQQPGEGSSSSKTRRSSSLVGKRRRRRRVTGCDQGPTLSPTRQSLLARRARDTLWQAIYYVGCFFLAWIFPTILRIHELLVEEIYYHWVFLSAMFVPSQGVWNFIVYVRPRYQQICADRQRRRDRQRSLRQARRVADERGEEMIDPTLTLRDGSATAWCDANMVTSTTTKNPSSHNPESNVSETTGVVAKLEGENSRATTPSPPSPPPGKEDARQQATTKDSSETQQEIGFGTVILQGKRNIRNFVYDIAQAVKEGDRGLGSVHVISIAKSEHDASHEEDSFAYDHGSFEVVEQQGPVKNTSQQESLFIDPESLAIKEQEDDEKGDAKSFEVEELEKVVEEEEEEVEEQVAKSSAKPKSSSRHSAEDVALVESLRSILHDMADHSSRHGG